MLHRVEIAFLFISFELLGLESEQILQEWTCHKLLTSDTSLTAEKALISGMTDFVHLRGKCRDYAHARASSVVS